MRQQNISATDRHPDAHAFLDFNAELNDLPLIPYERSSWGHADSSLGRFDLIIGSDLLYEKSNIELLSQFLVAHTEHKCEIVLIDPGRGLFAQFGKRMQELGFRCSDRIKVKQLDLPGCPDAYKGSLLRYERG